MGHLRVALHPRAVGTDRGHGHDARLGVVEAVFLAGDEHARGKTLDVPLEWTRPRLVEIVEVEHQCAFRAHEDPEVEQVRIATELHREPREGVVARS